MGATHFLMKRLPHLAAEMALHVLAYNLTRVMNVVGRQRLLAAIGLPEVWKAPDPRPGAWRRQRFDTAETRAVMFISFVKLKAA